MREERASLLADRTIRGLALCRALSDLADGWLRDRLPAEPEIALIAVGSYGRRQLAPGSDLDLLLVHRGRPDIGSVADALWYPLWDTGVPLDHSVRTPKEVLAAAEADLAVALGLLDGRCVAGDETLAADVLASAHDRWRRLAPRRLPELLDAAEERQRRHGDVAFLLEPDLKEAHGGLRDCATLRALALGSPVVDQASIRAHVVEAERVLTAARAELQREAGRALNELRLERQDDVARALRYADADELMAAVATAGRAVGWALDDAGRRVRSALAGPSGRGTRDSPVGPGLVLRDGEVALSPTADPAADPSLLLRAGAASATLSVPFARSALDRLVAAAPALPDPWPATCREAFVALLGAGPAAVPVFETLDQLGLIERILPEWDGVRSKPQRNAYHRFTVDRHLLETAANAAALTRRVARPDLLLVGALLHDIGKGRAGEDHTEAGMRIIGHMGPRLGFPPADVAVLVRLVEHHLLLADAATRRDLDDPRTIEDVAGAVGDETTLELLAALTEADSLATGPSAWSDWKAGLLGDLTARVVRRLRGAAAAPDADAGFPGPAERDLMAREGVTVAADGPRVTVVAPDRPGLLWRVAAVLALHGVDVRSAMLASEHGTAVEVFDVEPAHEDLPDWDAVGLDVDRALHGRLALDARMAERERTYAPRYRLRSARPAEPRALFHDHLSTSATVIEVRSADGVGVLYRITRALADCELDVRSAKVVTLGHEVVDTFYVRDASGGLITDPDHRREIERALLAALSRSRT